MSRFYRLSTLTFVKLNTCLRCLDIILQPLFNYISIRKLDREYLIPFNTFTRNKVYPCFPRTIITCPRERHSLEFLWHKYLHSWNKRLLAFCISPVVALSPCRQSTSMPVMSFCISSPFIPYGMGSRCSQNAKCECLKCFGALIDKIKSPLLQCYII